MELKKKLCFIVNPISGFGKQKVIEKLINDYLNLSIYDYKVVYTKAAKHATELSKKAVSENYDIVVAVGGDGSINEIARSLINTTTSLAIVPAGSGNGLARHLNIPLKLIQAIELINTGKSRKIDSCQLNDEFFFNVAGLGFDAFIGFKIAKLTKRGFFAYFKLIAKGFSQYKDQEYELIIDGKKYTKNAFLICFANGSQWGNGAFISPQSTISDGILNVAILKNVNVFNVLKVSYQTLAKLLHKSSNIEIIDVKKEITIQQVSEIAHIDGEPITVGKSVTVKINPLSLNVIAP